MSSKGQLLRGPRYHASAFDLTPRALPGVFKIGVNVSGPESTYTIGGTLLHNAYPDWSMLMHWASRGVNYIRLPLSWTILQPTLGGAISAAAFKEVSTVMAMAATLGIQILMDQNHSTADGAGRAEGAIGSSAVPTSAIADFVGRFVTACQADPNYAVIRGWDTTNEPHHMDPNDATNTSTTVSRAVVQDMLQKIIASIRATGDTKPIYCEADHYSGAWDWVDNNGALFLALSDPASNLVASVHCYLDRDSSGSNFDWETETAQPGFAPPGLSPNVNIGIQRLSKVVAWAYAHGVKLHLGEAGWGYLTDGWRQAGKALLDYLVACNIEFTYWSSGYNFAPQTAQVPGGYGYSPDPYNATTGGRDWTPKGTSKPQSVLLQKYATAPTAFPLFLPFDGSGNYVRRGISGVASGTFSFVVGGNVSSAISVVPRARFVDGTTATGTFSPAAITIPPGAYTDQEYDLTFTPSTSDLFMIDLVDGSGAVLPSVATIDGGGSPILTALAYSSAPDNFVPFTTANIVNVFGLRRLYSPYVGPAIRLKRASDSAQKDFYFNRRGDLPRQAIQDWAGSRSIAVVIIYDQSPAANHMTVSQSSPVLTLTNAAGYPEITVGSGQGMVFNSPVNGNVAQSILSRVYDVNGGSTFISQDNAGNGSFYPFRFAPSGYDVNNNAAVVNPGRIANAWHHYAGTFQSNATGGLIAYRDGTQVAQANTPSAPLASLSGSTTLGYFVFYTPSFWTGSWQNLVLFNVTLTGAQIAAFASDDSTYYSTALPDTLSAVAPTVSGASARSAVAGKSTTPFTGVTISDNNTGTPTDAVTITVSGSGGTLSGSGLSGTGPYSLASAVPATITSQLQALTFTPAGAAGTSATLTLAVSSSAGTSVSNAATVVSVIAVAAAETSYAAPSGTFAPVSYKGVNIAGADNTYPSGSQYNYIYPQNSEIDYFASKGMGLIRMPIQTRRFQPASYGALDPAGRTDEPAVSGSTAGTQTNLLSIKRVLDYAFTKGIRVIIDLHNYGGITDTLTNSSRTIGADSEGTAQFVDVWTRIATKFKNYPNVIWGLENEPVGMSAAQWKTGATAAINAIASVTTAQLVLIPGGANYTGAHDWTSSGNAAAWTGYVPPTGLPIAFEMHQYLDSNDSGTSTTVVAGKGAGVLDQSGGLATTWCRNNGFKAFLGEVGWSFNDSQTSGGVPSTEGKAIFDFMSANSDVWMGWSYWLGGSSAFYGSYIYNVVPTGSAGAYTDKPQMAILTAHL